MGKILFITIIISGLLLAYWAYRKSVVSRRETLIDTYKFPPSITNKIIEQYPHLTDTQVDEVIETLREYFHLCNIAGNKMVAMPSQVVDVAWHEFILFTRKYDYFCKRALGRFLHHTPAEAMTSPKVAQGGIKMAWKTACQRERIKPTAAHKLPILFAIDAKLNIAGGFKYSLDCSIPGNKDYCAGHIHKGSGCGGCGGGSSCSGGDGGGCGGGCSGG